MSPAQTKGLKTFFDGFFGDHPLERLWLFGPVVMGFGVASLYLSDLSVLTPILIPALAVFIFVLFGIIFAIIRLKEKLSLEFKNIIALGMGFLLFFCLGLLISSARIQAVSGPALPQTLKPIQFEAIVVDVDTSSDQSRRFIVAPLHLEGTAPKNLPHRLRLNLRSNRLDPVPLSPGDVVQGQALAMGLPIPLLPGGYDFGRDLFFKGEGGILSARYFYRLDGKTVLDRQDVGLKFRIALNRFRLELSESLVRAMGIRTGGMGAAMITGIEAYLQDSDLNALRDSGLAHMLSISGLHMALVGGFLFFLFRALLALHFHLTLILPIKKLAAALALLGISGYLLISGAPAPAIRSYVTLAVMFIGILMGRRAFSFSSLAVSALVVIMIMPESVLQPGFQMSYAATLALVAYFDQRKERPAALELPWILKTFYQWLDRTKDLVLTGLMVTLATEPIAMIYFGRIAVYGTLSNLASDLFEGLVVMPELFLGTSLGPEGAGKPFLILAGFGLTAITTIADFVSKLPLAIFNLAPPPLWTLGLYFAGLMPLILLRGRVRFFGFVLIGLALFWPRERPMDLWIDAQGRQVLVQSQKTLGTVWPTKSTYAQDHIAKTFGLLSVKGSNFVCKKGICTGLLPKGTRVLIVRGQKTTELDCKAFDLFILPRQAMGQNGCPGRAWIDQDLLKKHGHLFLTEAGQGQVTWQGSRNPRRPWS